MIRVAVVRWVCGLLCVAFLLQFRGAPPVLAAPPVGNKYAVIVGIADYPGTTNDLNFTDDDANDLRDTLVSRAGFSPSNINLLLNASATKSNIQSAITSWLDSREGSQDLVVFYFSGHGTTVTDVSPYDESDGYDECLVAYNDNIRDDELNTWLSYLESQNVVVIIDSCFSGGMVKAGQKTIKGITGDMAEAKFLADSATRDGMAKDINVSGRIVVTACDDDQYSYERPELQNGVLTYFLLVGFSAAPDANGNDWISIEEDYNYLRDEVDQYDRTANGGEGQDALLYDGVAGQVDLTGVLPPIAYLPFVAKPPMSVVAFPNGDFEAGATKWTQYSAHGWSLITTDLPSSVPPHSGSWAVWLGGDYDDISYVQQRVTVPSGARYLAYWHWIVSGDDCGYDLGGVIVDGTVVDVYDLCSAEETDGWVKHVVNLGAYAGRSVSIQIRAETDESWNSNLFVDDVAFQSRASTTGTSTHVPAVPKQAALKSAGEAHEAVSERPDVAASRLEDPKRFLP